MWFTLIKRYFDAGLYIAEQIAIFTAAGYITETQAEKIVGEI